VRWRTGTARKPAPSPTAGPEPRSCCGPWPPCTTQTPARRRPGPNDPARGSGSKALGSARPSAARHSDTDADGRRAAGHARPARSSVRGEPPATEPGRCTSACGRSRRCAVHEKYMEGVSAVDGRWMGVAMPGMCPGVLGPRQQSGWVARARVYSPEGSLASRVLPAGLAVLRPLRRPVRGCPWDRRRGRPGARTYSGQRALRKRRLASFAQVRCDMEVQVGAVCKTVGSTLSNRWSTQASQTRTPGAMSISVRESPNSPGSLEARSVSRATCCAFGGRARRLSPFRSPASPRCLPSPAGNSPTCSYLPCAASSSRRSTSWATPASWTSSARSSRLRTRGRRPRAHRPSRRHYPRARLVLNGAAATLAADEGAAR
jgi:hypothetical protein